jgi:hypothetical protein
MKIKFLLLFLISITILNAQQFLAPDPIYSEVLKENRPYFVTLPHSYTNSTYTLRNYPVIVLLDGTNHRWYSYSVLEFLSRNNIIPECIIVSVPNTNDRTKDLTPSNSIIDYDGTRNINLQSSGGGDDFLEFIYNELLPKIDQDYNTLDLKVFIGHSFGGLTATHAFLSNSSPFKAFISMDPSLWWDNAMMQSQLDSVKYLSNTKVWYMTGANNCNFHTDTSIIRTLQKKFHTTLKSKFDSTRMEYQIYENEDHGSVTMKSLYDGIRFVFKDFRVTLDLINDTSVFNNHYRKQSEFWGVEVKPNEQLINEIAYGLMAQEKKKQALQFFQLNIELYPNSFNAFNSLGEYYLSIKNQELAIKSFKISLQLNPNNQNAINKLKTLNY